MSTGPADALAADGRIVSIRPVTARDRRAIAALYERASPENLRLRFFTWPTPATLAAEVDRLCRPQSGRFLAMLACEGDEVVGVASCDRTGDGPRGEFAVLVADRHHGRGIGTLLLEHLAARARRHGITAMTGEVLPGNTGMLKVARDLGPGCRPAFGEGVMDVVVDIGDDRTRSAIDHRDRVAGHASLRAFFTPASVAVAGAGRRPGGAGHETVRALQEYGFAGRVYAVNRSGAPIGATPGYRSLRDLPEPIELLVVAVPGDDVADVLRDGAAAGAHAAIVLTPGSGRAARTDLLTLARSLGIRVIGPGSLGVLNTAPATRLNAGLFPVTPPAGGLAVATQSGAVALALIENAARTGCGISSVVTLGEKADVTGNELINYWYDDPATRAVALHLESFANPGRFARLVRTLSYRKPVLAVRDPRSPATVDALFAQAGVVRTDNWADLMDAARMLTGQPLPAGRRLAVVSNAGDVVAGPGLTGRTVEVEATASAARFAAAAADAEGDMLLLVVAGTRVSPAVKILDALGVVADRRPQLPVAAVVIGGEGPAQLGNRGAPVYDLPERAMRALAHAADYAEWRRTPAGSPVEPGDVDPHRARTAIATALARGGGRQPAGRTAAVLAAYGIRLTWEPAGSAVHLVAGAVHDPLLGALVLLGDGPAQVPGDWTLGLAPLSELDAGRMCRSLRRAPQLNLTTGAALADLLLRLSRLAGDHPEIAGVDLDVQAGADGVRVVDADLRIAAPGAEPDPALRRLRGPETL
ncbi:GNAT family N-acetyltransferase [Actinoplanes teichomyceticus]|uniref:Acyl-CoA synthetase (NDP forming) n=1 Tax=Actinoplanes teichomyceticus TaxID=1867 RepID=A0A561VI95_ACTTI|nr:GNAT family N-acetyltransferase [Actinoplanes teichomyceticus]TWG11331.1 acyl-CoA synthetase (NDP forming) [Actinoplanes teichomyceticus]GIF16363.1 hypothetical protein Ate01nite_63950 [Actinoplanes teichomyceticus]